MITKTVPASILMDRELRMEEPLGKLCILQCLLTIINL